MGVTQESAVVAVYLYIIWYITAVRRTQFATLAFWWMTARAKFYCESILTPPPPSARCHRHVFLLPRAARATSENRYFSARVIFSRVFRLLSCAQRYATQPINMIFRTGRGTHHLRVIGRRMKNDRSKKKKKNQNRSTRLWNFNVRRFAQTVMTNHWCVSCSHLRKLSLKANAYFYVIAYITTICVSRGRLFYTRISILTSFHHDANRLNI